MKKKSIEHENSSITYQVKKSRKRSSVGILVKPDLTVTVSAPAFCSDREIETIVEKKSKWIFNKLKRFQELSEKNPIRKYTNGEKHLYLGDEYHLVIRPNAPLNKVFLENRSINILLKKNADPEEIRKHLYKWYREKAFDIFDKTINLCLPFMKSCNIEKPELKVIRMKSRWGSCHPSKNLITLNTELIRTPGQCIEYVTVHELCHLKHPGHGKDFYALLSNVMPDWKDRKKILERFLL